MNDRAPPFVVLALPRSRSFWLSRFLQYNDWQCSHDEVRHFRSLDDVQAWLSQPCTGSVETAAAPFWRLLLHYRPDTRIVTVRRPVDEVCESMAAIFPVNREGMLSVLHRLDRKLDQIEHRTDALRIEYDDLNSEEVCATLFEYCLPYDHDHGWWQAMAALNLQVNLAHVWRYMNAYMPQLERLAKQAKHRMIAAMQRLVPQLNGVAFQLEKMVPFYAEAQPLLAEHLVRIEDSPDAQGSRNLPMLEKLEELGGLQIVTARSDGRLCGYLVSIIGPSFDDRDKQVATHCLFFASPKVRNLPMGLQYAAIRFLRERGVDQLQARVDYEGGAGSRLSAVYRRLGAEEFGRMYRLEIQ